MSKLGAIKQLIEGSHVMSEDGLRDYHVARQVRDACRIKNFPTKFYTIKHLLHPYRVMVTISGAAIRVYRPETQAEINL